MGSNLAFFIVLITVQVSLSLMHTGSSAAVVCAFGLEHKESFLQHSAVKTCSSVVFQNVRSFSSYVVTCFKESWCVDAVGSTVLLHEPVRLFQYCLLKKE